MVVSDRVEHGPVPPPASRFRPDVPALGQPDAYTPREIVLSRWSWPVPAARFPDIYDPARAAKTPVKAFRARRKKVLSC